MKVWEYADDNKTKRDSGRTVDVAHLIAVLARVFRINPKVLITKLEKEESLITGVYHGEPIDPDWLMMIVGCGFGVYDGKQQTAKSSWSGIDRQLTLAALLCRSYFNNADRRYPVPQQYPASMTTGEGDVPVFNRATYVLYYYTPHTVTRDGQGNIAFVTYWWDFFGKGTLGSN